MAKPRRRAVIRHTADAEVVIGRGSLIWYGRKWKRGRKLSWSRFADVMEAL